LSVFFCFKPTSHCRPVKPPTPLACTSFTTPLLMSVPNPTKLRPQYFAISPSLDVPPRHCKPFFLLLSFLFGAGCLFRKSALTLCFIFRLPPPHAPVCSPFPIFPPRLVRICGVLQAAPKGETTTYQLFLPVLPPLIFPFWSEVSLFATRSPPPPLPLWFFFFPQTFLLSRKTFTWWFPTSVLHAFFLVCFFFLIGFLLLFCPCCSGLLQICPFFAACFFLSNENTLFDTPFPCSFAFGINTLLRPGAPLARLLLYSGFRFFLSFSVFSRRFFIFLRS